MIQHYMWLYCEMIKYSKWNIIFIFGLCIGYLPVQYLSIYISKLTVSLVTEKSSLPKAVGILAAAALLMLIFKLFYSACSLLMKNQSLKLRHVLERRAMEQFCSTSYSNLETPEYRGRIDRAKELYERWESDVSECVYTSTDVVASILEIVITSSILMTLNPILIVIMAVTVFMQYQIGKIMPKWMQKHRDFWMPIEQKIGYITGKIIEFTSAKDMRLYAADRWLMPKYFGLMKERRRWNRKAVFQNAKVDLLMLFTSTIQTAAIYTFLIWAVFYKGMTADNFVFYLGLALSFSASLQYVVSEIKDLRVNVIAIEDYRKMTEVDEAESIESKEMELPKAATEIKFSHVTFRYPEADKDTLKDIHVTIRKGEKNAIVGLNGAGKTTLIKMLCGMYKPTGGAILIDGKPISSWSREHYYQMFSVIFQDLGVVPATLAENVASCRKEELDRERVIDCLKKAGLWSFAKRLSKGIDTYVPKEVFEGGINLSGGETQKLLLARAIYKDAPILILDEPTAALDAIAENELYLKYQELTKNRTSIYISHRLSSTRFCDRILMMENGQIVEVGNHDELMKKKGNYYQLYQVQSHYYQNDRTEEFQSEIDPTWEVNGYVSE